MLTHSAVKKAKASEKLVKIYDERGLLLLVTPAGGKLWRFKYRFRGREMQLAFGAFPDVSLADARDKRDAARKLVAAGVDPAEQRRAERKAEEAKEVEEKETFEFVAREWLENSAPKWTPGYVDLTLKRMEHHFFPHIGKRVIREIEPPELLEVIRRIEQCGKFHTAHRMLTVFGQVARYAIATGRASRDPSPDLRDALAPVKDTEHRAAIVDPAELGKLLRQLDGYDGSLIVRCALRLAPLLVVRPGELRGMEWSEINFETSTWIIPNWRMKMRQAHVTPLSTQALVILRELYAVTGHTKYAFPSARSPERPMSDNAVLSALRRMEIPKETMSGHGFRAVFRTLADEVLHERLDLIEHQLAHTVRDPLGTSYNRTQFLEERRLMMTRWSDYLDSLKAGGVAGVTRA